MAPAWGIWAYFAAQETWVKTKFSSKSHSVVPGSLSDRKGEITLAGLFPYCQTYSEESGNYNVDLEAKASPKRMWGGVKDIYAHLGETYKVNLGWAFGKGIHLYMDASNCLKYSSRMILRQLIMGH